MKKLITLAMLIISINCFAQVNVEIGANNNGVRMGIGFVQEETGAGLSLTHNAPMISTEKANVTTLSALYEWRNEIGFNITGLIGVALHSYNDAGKYLGNSNKTTLSYGIELGKDWHKGRLFVSCAYSGLIYVGGGMKIRFK